MGCGSNSEEISQPGEKCPACNGKGEPVGRFTVEHLVTEDNRKAVEGDQYHICMNETCDVVYYNIDNGVKFLKNQIKVPIWFKKNANPKYACYCSKTTEDEVIEAVVKHGAKTVKEVIEITGAMKNDNCRENNPMGVCCHNIIQEAINKGLAMK